MLIFLPHEHLLLSWFLCFYFAAMFRYRPHVGAVAGIYFQARVLYLRAASRRIRWVAWIGFILCIFEIVYFWNLQFFCSLEHVDNLCRKKKKNTAWLSLNLCWMIVQYLVMNLLESLRWRNPDEIAKLVLNFNFSKFPNSRHPLYTDSSQSFISCPGRAKPNPSRCLICPKEIEQNRKPTPPCSLFFFFFMVMFYTLRGSWAIKYSNTLSKPPPDSKKK